MPRRSRCDSYDNDRAYDAWLEAREEAEEAERQEAWEAEVDENCECVYAEDDAHYRYYDWDYVKPLKICAWHAERAATRAAAAAEEESRRQEEQNRLAVDAYKRKTEAAIIAEEIGIELPEGYIAPLRAPPAYNITHKWRVTIHYAQQCLYILEGQGVPEELRVRVIGQLFEYLSHPDNIGLVYENVKFRTVVIAKIAEFRGDQRAEPIKESLERMEVALQEMMA